MASDAPKSKPEKYRSDWTDAQLREMVRETALKVCPNRPEILSTRKFDDSREAMGWPDAPRARWIAERLGHSWPQLVKIAVDEKRDATMTSSAARRAPAEKWLDLRHLHFAINYVSKRRGEETFGANDYDNTRQEVIDSGKHSPKENTLATILPTSLQLMQIVRRMDAAEKAKAEAEAKKGGSAKAKAKKTRDPLPDIGDSDEVAEVLSDEEKVGVWNRVLALAGKPPYEKRKQEGVAIPYAIHLYIDAAGVIPWSEAELKRFASDAGFSLRPLRKEPGWVAGRGRRDTLLPFYPAAAEIRRKLGLPMADELGSAKAKPVFDLSKLPPNLPPPVRNQNFWAENPDKIIEALWAYLDDCAERNVREPTRRDYLKRQSLHRGEWPTASTLGRVGEKSFTKWIERAQKERRARKKQAA